MRYLNRIETKSWNYLLHFRCRCWLSEKLTFEPKSYILNLGLKRTNLSKRRRSSGTRSGNATGCGTSGPTRSTSGLRRPWSCRPSSAAATSCHSATSRLRRKRRQIQTSFLNGGWILSNLFETCLCSLKTSSRDCLGERECISRLSDKVRSV